MVGRDPVGPNAGKILQAAGVDISLDPNDFPFMTMREAHIAGLPVRIFRISFTGELSYEINIRARHGLALWTHLMKAGAEYGSPPMAPRRCMFFVPKRASSSLARKPTVR